MMRAGSWCNGTGELPGAPQPRTHFKASDTCFFGDDNVAVSDGKLMLTNRREKSHGLNYTSGVINSINYGPGHGFQQLYGYFEARVQPSPGQHNLGMCESPLTEDVMLHSGLLLQMLNN